MPVLCFSCGKMWYCWCYRWLAQYERMTGLCYVWAFAALLALALGVMAVMSLTLVADGARHRRHGFG